MVMLLSLSAHAAGAATAVRAVSASRIANAIRFIPSPPISLIGTHEGARRVQ